MSTNIFQHVCKKCFHGKLKKTFPGMQLLWMVILIQQVHAQSNDLVLENTTISNRRTFSATNSITAGPNFTIAGSGDVTFGTPNVYLRGQFVIVNGGQFRVYNDEVQTPVLLVTPTTLDFDSMQTSMTFQISNTGSGTLTWNITENPDKPWITSVSPNNGSGNTTVTVTVDRTQLAGSSDTDTLVVNSNGGTQNVTVLISKDSQAPSIAPDAPVTAQCDQEFYVPIIVGNPNPVSNLLGVSFDLNYPTTYIDYMSYSFTDPQGSVSNFLGSNIVPFVLAEDATGKVGVGVTKTGGAGATGSGPVVWLKFKSATDTPDPTNIVWSLSNVTANDANGGAINFSPSTATTVIKCSGCIVWPGDTNNDGVVDTRDVLPIGYLYGKTGPERPGASPLWSGQSVICWDPEAAAYADAGGNGKVGTEDVLPIGLNYGKTHSAAMAAREQNLISSSQAKTAPASALKSISQTPKIKPVVSAISGDSITVDVLVTDVTGLFGLSFDFVYQDNSDSVEALSAAADPFFGSDILFLPNINTATKTVSVGMSRKAGQGGIDGTGNVARVILQSYETAPFGTSVSFDLQNVTANDANGNSITFTVESSDPVITDVDADPEINTALPESFMLSQNYPNPFNPETTIAYQLPQAAEVTLTIYDLQGHEVRRLDYGKKSTGQHVVKWDGRNEQGWKVSSGIYFYRIEMKAIDAGQKPYMTVKKMILMK